MIGGKHDGPADTLEVLEPGNAHPREDAAERQDPCRLADAPNHANDPPAVPRRKVDRLDDFGLLRRCGDDRTQFVERLRAGEPGLDRKSTRLNSSHSQISYAVFCLKKKKKKK